MNIAYPLSCVGFADESPSSGAASAAAAVQASATGTRQKVAFQALPPSSTVDAADFAAMAASMQEEDERRERLIKGSRDVLKSSKVAIYSLHRREFEKARQLLESAKASLRDDLIPGLATQPHLRFSLGGACEEYAEAVVFQQYLLTGRVPSLASMEGIVSRDEFLGGVLDFAGELGRFAVLRATSRDFDAVKRARDCVDELMAQFMGFDFRNGGLRRKYDGLKYTLKKVRARAASHMRIQPLSGHGIHGV